MTMFSSEQKQRWNFQKLWAVVCSVFGTVWLPYPNGNPAKVRLHSVVVTLGYVGHELNGIVGGRGLTAKLSNNEIHGNKYSQKYVSVCYM